MPGHHETFDFFRRRNFSFLDEDDLVSFVKGGIEGNRKTVVDDHIRIGLELLFEMEKSRLRRNRDLFFVYLDSDMLRDLFCHEDESIGERWECQGRSLIDF